MKKLVLAVVVALMISGSTFAANESFCQKRLNDKFSAEVMYWDAALSGHVQVGELVTGGNTNRIDLEDDANMDDDSVVGINLSYKLAGRTTLEFAYSNQENDSNFRLTQNFEFDGKTFQANADIKMDLKNAWYNVSVAKTFVDQNHNGLNSLLLKGRLGVKVNDAEIDVQGTDSLSGLVESKSWSETLPIPYIGIEASSQMTDILGLYFNFNFFKATISDYDAVYRDLTLAVKARLNRGCKDKELYLNLGYRSVKYDVKGDGDAILMEYDGPVVGLELLF